MYKALKTILFLLQTTALVSLKLSASSHGIRYHLRQATVDDIFKINQCNLANLKKSYSYEYYYDQILRFPDLSLIAETDESEMMGYALGRLDQLPEKLDGNPIYCGHLVSLAINSHFRGNGVARQLLGTIHGRLADYYNVDSIFLFCRVSNAPAFNLYKKTFGYEVINTVPEHYNDKEDAFLMSAKGLKAQYHKAQPSDSGFTKFPQHSVQVNSCLPM